MYFKKTQSLNRATTYPGRHHFINFLIEFCLNLDTSSPIKQLVFFIYFRTHFIHLPNPFPCCFSFLISALLLVINASVHFDTANGSDFSLLDLPRLAMDCFTVCADTSLFSLFLYFVYYIRSIWYPVLNVTCFASWSTAINIQ